MPEPKYNKFTAITSEKNGTTAEEVVARLREIIQRGDLSAGDRLPPERDLAKLLGVSRPTLRAGIRSLAAVGLLQSRQGAGTFVAKPEEMPLLDDGLLRMSAALRGFTSDEMLEAGLSIETEIASLAAERAAGEQIKQMSEEVAGMYAALDNPEQYLDHEMRFHRIIAEASGNRILAVLMNLVSAGLFEYRRTSVENAKDLKDYAERQHKIYRAMRERNPKVAREAMRGHLLETRAVHSTDVGEKKSDAA